jgi:hypothetical protein
MDQPDPDHFLDDLQKKLTNRLFISHISVQASIFALESDGKPVDKAGIIF